MYKINDLNKVVFPGSILRKVVAYDPSAYGEITAYADQLFNQQKAARYIPIKQDNTLVPNPITLVWNFVARSYNAKVEKESDPLMVPAQFPTGYDPVYALTPSVFFDGPQIMTQNMARGLLAYIEKDKERVMSGAKITREELHELRDFAGWENKASIRPLERTI